MEQHRGTVEDGMSARARAFEQIGARVIDERRARGRRRQRIEWHIEIVAGAEPAARAIDDELGVREPPRERGPRVRRDPRNLLRGARGTLDERAGLAAAISDRTSGAAGAEQDDASAGELEARARARVDDPRGIGVV